MKDLLITPNAKTSDFVDEDGAKPNISGAM
jgi:hypothetical protein